MRCLLYGQLSCMGRGKEQAVSKKAKEKKRIERAKIKAAKKSANYLKFGPKAGHVGRRQKKRIKKQLRTKASNGPVRQDMPGAKTRAKRRRTSPTRKTRIAKFPLRQLRKRRHLGCPSRGERGLDPR